MTPQVFEGLIFTIFTMMLTCILIASYVIYRLLDRINKIKDELLQLAKDKGYFTKKPFMRKDEINLYNELRKLIKSDLILLPQVPLSQIIDVKNGFKDHDNLYNELSRRIVDYCILDRNYNPLCIIELNGASHYYQNRKNRAKGVENVAQNCGIRYIEILKNMIYKEKYVNDLIEDYC